MIWEQSWEGTKSNVFFSCVSIGKKKEFSIVPLPISKINSSLILKSLVKQKQIPRTDILFERKKKIQPLKLNYCFKINEYCRSLKVEWALDSVPSSQGVYFNHQRVRAVLTTSETTQKPSFPQNIPSKFLCSHQKWCILSQGAQRGELDMNWAARAPLLLVTGARKPRSCDLSFCGSPEPLAHPDQAIPACIPLQPQQDLHSGEPGAWLSDTFFLAVTWTWAGALPLKASGASAPDFFFLQQSSYNYLLPRVWWCWYQPCWWSLMSSGNMDQSRISIPKLLSCWIPNGKRVQPLWAGHFCASPEADLIALRDWDIKP